MSSIISWVSEHLAFSQATLDKWKIFFVVLDNNFKLLTYIYFL